MFKMAEEGLNMLARHMENTDIKVQIKLLQMRNIISEMKNSLGGNNSRLETAEEKIRYFKI